MTVANPPALEFRDIRVAYGEVTALAGLDIAFPRDAIHAVVGQNGAGKTTLARVAAGLVRPDAGSLRIDGRPLRLGHVAGARAAGVELVHQSFALPPSFSVAEALEFGAERGLGLYRQRDMTRRCRERLKAVDLDVDPGSRIRDLPVEVQQGVEIARALIADARILILDEPTAVLPPSRIETLFNRAERLKANGVTVILILHKIREVFAVADTISVLRNGRLVAGPISRPEADQETLSEMIVGGSGTKAHGAGRAGATIRAPAVSERLTDPEGGYSDNAVLELADVTTSKEPGEPPLDRVSLTVGRGEIVGVAGVEGNGQRTLVKTIAGIVDTANGHIHLKGAQATRSTAAGRRALGLRIIPFDRDREGLSLTSALWENWSVRSLLQRPLIGLADPNLLRRQCDESLRAWDVHYASAQQNASALSGGNAQKVVLAREIDEGARVILAAQPARGLDVGAAEFVWSALRAAAARGCGVLLISSDLDELFDVSHRLLVMLTGRIAGEFTPPYDIGAVGRALTGATS